MPKRARRAMMLSRRAEKASYLPRRQLHGDRIHVMCQPRAIRISCPDARTRRLCSRSRTCLPVRRQGHHSVNDQLRKPRRLYPDLHLRHMTYRCLPPAPRLHLVIHRPFHHADSDLPFSAIDKPANDRPGLLLLSRPSSQAVIRLSAPTTLCRPEVRGLKVAITVRVISVLQTS